MSKNIKDYLHVNVWTVNDEQRMREVIALGVSGVITDKPEVAIDVWNEFGK
jgi:glycerophosphoryl diester phosphodiesterase